MIRVNDTIIYTVTVTLVYSNSSLVSSRFKYVYSIFALSRQLLRVYAPAGAGHTIRVSSQTRHATPHQICFIACGSERAATGGALAPKMLVFTRFQSRQINVSGAQIWVWAECFSFDEKSGNPQHPTKYFFQKIRVQVWTVSWVLRDYAGTHHPLSPVINLGLRHTRKKKRKGRASSGSADPIYMSGSTRQK